MYLWEYNKSLGYLPRPPRVKTSLIKKLLNPNMKIC